MTISTREVIAAARRAFCGPMVTVALLCATPASAADQAQPGATPQAGAPSVRAAAAPPSPATIKRARKVLVDAVVKEVAARQLGDCTTGKSIGARIVSVERFDQNTRIWPVHATAVCTTPNAITEVPAMTFNMTRDAKGGWHAAYVKDDAN